MLTELLPFLTSTKDVIKTLREIVALLPEKEKSLVDAKLSLAERELMLSEAEMARKLGYPLCKCTFPPQIMTLKQGENYVFQCRSCQRDCDTTPTIQHYEDKFSW